MAQTSGSSTVRGILERMSCSTAFCPAAAANITGLIPFPVTCCSGSHSGFSLCLSCVCLCRAECCSKSWTISTCPAAAPHINAESPFSLPCVMSALWRSSTFTTSVCPLAAAHITCTQSRAIHSQSHRDRQPETGRLRETHRGVPHGSLCIHVRVRLEQRLASGRVSLLCGQCEPSEAIGVLDGDQLGARSDQRLQPVDVAVVRRAQKVHTTHAHSPPLSRKVANNRYQFLSQPQQRVPRVQWFFRLSISITGRRCLPASLGAFSLPATCES